jgi:hypothetical protein
LNAKTTRSAELSAGVSRTFKAPVAAVNIDLEQIEVAHHLA